LPHRTDGLHLGLTGEDAETVGGDGSSAMRAAEGLAFVRGAVVGAKALRQNRGCREVFHPPVSV